MPTRLHALSVAHGVPPISPAFGAWSDTGGAVRRWMKHSGAAEVLRPQADTEEVARAEAVATSPYDVLLVQLISAPLAAQTVSGTLKGQIRAWESAADADFRSQLTARVVSGDGATVRGTLVALSTGPLSSEWPAVGAPGINRKFPPAAISPVTMTPVAASAGDRLVIEVGYRSHNTHTTSRTGTVALSPGDSADLPEDETATAGRPWFEISADLTWQPTQRRITAALLEAAVANPAVQRRITAALLEAAVANPAVQRRITAALLEAVVEEYWYGWGVKLEEE